MTIPDQRYSGRLTHWINDRGYGFLSHPSGEDIFVHVSSLPHGYRPNCGDAFSYAITHRNGKPRAIDLRRA
jgi:cold shock CspA family protein